MVAGRVVTYHGVDGSTWHLHGPDMGAEGVYLTSLAGFYFPVRKPLSQSPAYMRGAKPGPPKTDPSRIGLKIFTSAGTESEWEEIENDWWAAWSDEQDGLLVATNRAGVTRSQPVRIETWPEDPFDFEPDTEMDWAMRVIAYSPGWRGPLLESTWTNTGGDPTATGTLLFANPGDVEIWPQFAGWGHEDEVITLPDGIGGASVPVADLADGEHWLVDSDQMQIVAETVLDTQLAARMPALRFQHPIPAGTVTPVPVDVSVTGGSAATEVKAYMQTLYQRPF